MSVSNLTLVVTTQGVASRGRRAAPQLVAVVNIYDRTGIKLAVRRFLLKKRYICW